MVAAMKKEHQVAATQCCPQNLYGGRAVLCYCFGGHGQDQISMSEHMFPNYATVYELLM
jgi:hypothetical protein